MSRAQPNILASIEDNVPDGGRLLLGVSGGIDSIVLLHACVSLRRKLSLHIEVAHFNHGLRPSSDRDAEFVKEYAAEFGLPTHVECPLAPPVAGTNIEQWGRQQRYSFFERVRTDARLDYILTAHQADDVAETLLMRLLSNKEPGELSRFDRRRKLIRPLYSIPRASISDYADQYSLQWVEDETNSDEAFLRNKVRIRLLPLLQEQFDPRASETLALRAAALAEDSSALDAWAASELSRLEMLPFGSRDWLGAACAILMALESAVQWRFVRDMLLPHIEFPLGRPHAQEVVDFIVSDRQGVELPGGFSIRRCEGGMRVFPKK